MKHVLGFSKKIDSATFFSNSTTCCWLVGSVELSSEARVLSLEP
jgi:hypothetical protein